jgi:hypothetical protein
MIYRSKRKRTMSKLSDPAKVGLVIGGYGMACLVACGVVYLWQLMSQGPAAQASSGMYAFGDLILFLGLAGLLMLLPTGLAVYFLVRWALERRETRELQEQ